MLDQMIPQFNLLSTIKTNNIYLKGFIINLKEIRVKKKNTY